MENDEKYRTYIFERHVRNVIWGYTYPLLYYPALIAHLIVPRSVFCIKKKTLYPYLAAPSVMASRETVPTNARSTLIPALPDLFAGFKRALSTSYYVAHDSLLPVRAACNTLHLYVRIIFAMKVRARVCSLSDSPEIFTRDWRERILPLIDLTAVAQRTTGVEKGSLSYVI